MTTPNDNRLRFLRDTCYGERSFYTSINRVEMISILDELIALRDFAGGAPNPSVEPNQPAVAEIAERLAKVEDRLAKVHLYPEHEKAHQAIHQRIDKVAEIIGERVSGLIDRLDKLEKPWEHQPVEVAPFPYPPAFPTGGADTAEAATEAVLPVPQRGDRVRLEGAVSVGGHPLKAGWYSVVGVDEEGGFQVRLDRGEDRGGIVGLDLFWVWAQHPGLKEVVHHG